MIVYEVYGDVMYETNTVDKYENGLSSEEILEMVYSSSTYLDCIGVFYTEDEAIKYAKEKSETGRFSEGFFVNFTVVNEVEYDDEDESDDGNVIKTIGFFVKPLQPLN